MRLLVTGGAGFIGSNLVRLLLESVDDVHVVNLDLLTYAGNLENLTDVSDDPRYTFVHGDIADPDTVRAAMEGADAVLNLAAESHVDRSIDADSPFVHTNFVGTHVLLSAALELGVERFLQVSTDEVYGELEWRDPEAHDNPGERFTEETPLAPRSPYSATKAAADHLAFAYHTTHGMDVVVTRCSNNYGPYQHPEKLIPLMITKALADEPLPVYGDGLNVRDWIQVEDHCRGILAALQKGRAGEAYNFGGDAERKNIQVVRTLLDAVGKPHDLVTYVTDRKGHDRRYGVDSSKAHTELGWAPTWSFEEGLEATVNWYMERRPEG